MDYKVAIIVRSDSSDTVSGEQGGQRDVQRKLTSTWQPRAGEPGHYFQGLSEA